MAIFECKMFSKELFSSVSVNVILPTPESGDYFFGTTTLYPAPGQKYQTLYLLHGFTADFSDWQRFSSIERYAQAHQLAVVMPSVNNSSYCNLRNGGNYYNYYLEELPAQMRAIFPLSAKRENNFVAGLSMGGFGTLKAAFTKPEMFAAAASLSGGAASRRKDEKAAEKTSPIDTDKWRAASYGPNGEYFNPETDDIWVASKNLVESGKQAPKIYIACGTEDFTYRGNLELQQYLKDLGLDVTYEEGPGRHDMAFWDKYIERVIEWLPLTGGFVD